MDFGRTEMEGRNRTDESYGTRPERSTTASVADEVRHLRSLTEPRQQLHPTSAFLREKWLLFSLYAYALETRENR